MVEDRIILQDRGFDSMTAALLNNNMNNWSSNPFMYLIFLLLFGRGWNGFGENGNIGASELSAQISSNQNSNLIMDGIKGNAAAINQLA